MDNIYLSCNLCPKNCNVNRYKNKGYCNLNNKIKIAYANLYYYEEPCLSLKNGSGAIFFSGCNMKCIFCQNYEISTSNKGTYISIKKLKDIMLDLQY